MTALFSSIPPEYSGTDSFQEAAIDRIITLENKNYSCLFLVLQLCISKCTCIDAPVGLPRPSKLTLNDSNFQTSSYAKAVVSRQISSIKSELHTIVRAVYTGI